MHRFFWPTFWLPLVACANGLPCNDDADCRTGDVCATPRGVCVGGAAEGETAPAEGEGDVGEGDVGEGDVGEGEGEGEGEGDGQSSLTVIFTGPVLPHRDVMVGPDCAASLDSFQVFSDVPPEFVVPLAPGQFAVRARSSTDGCILRSDVCSDLAVEGDTQFLVPFNDDRIPLCEAWQCNGAGFCDPTATQPSRQCLGDESTSSLVMWDPMGGTTCLDNQYMNCDISVFNTFASFSDGALLLQSVPNQCLGAFDPDNLTVFDELSFQVEIGEVSGACLFFGLIEDRLGMIFQPEPQGTLCAVDGLTDGCATDFSTGFFRMTLSDGRARFFRSATHMGWNGGLYNPGTLLFEQTFMLVEEFNGIVELQLDACSDSLGTSGRATIGSIEIVPAFE
jgi:hypothetical protein